MIIYWKSATNEMMNESEYDAAKEKASLKIEEWAINHLYLNKELLDDFVLNKVEEYGRSFIKINLPFETEADCRDYLDHFYQDHLDVISLFPYDRWAWIQELETMHYGDYQIERVNVESQILDCKELGVH